VTSFEERLGHRFRRPELLELALTHRSYAHEQGLDGNYERLEFLGDAVLGAMTAEWLFAADPGRAEGELSRLKSVLVSEDSLAAFAADLGIGEALRLGVGEERSGGRGKRSLLADALEAILGALWLDGGADAVRPLVGRLLAQTMTDRERLRRADTKTRLQELLQGRGWELPLYRVAAEEGPDHRKRFVVECQVRGEVVGRGEGRSKKAAEQRAAARALERLAPAEPDPGAPADG
jgi:ribonuclease III